jgi:hypothetical protein
MYTRNQITKRLVRDQSGRPQADPDPVPNQNILDGGKKRKNLLFTVISFPMIFFCPREFTLLVNVGDFPFFCFSLSNDRVSPFRFYNEPITTPPPSAVW